MVHKNALYPALIFLIIALVISLYFNFSPEKNTCKKEIASWKKVACASNDIIGTEEKMIKILAEAQGIEVKTGVYSSSFKLECIKEGLDGST